MNSASRPWLCHYDEGVPHQLVYPNFCIQDLLKNQAERRPQKTAIVIGDKSPRYADLDRLSHNFACNLVSHGVKRGDVVGICLANSIEFVVSFFAVLKAGAIVAAMNPLFPGSELIFQVETSCAAVIITSNSKVRDFQLDGKGGRKIKLILVGETINPSQLGYEDFLREPPAEIVLPEIDPSDPAVVQFSGGTTGVPKAALGSHRNLVSNVTQFRHWLVNLEDGKETFLIAIPLYHVYGLVLGLILGISMGGRLVFTEKPGNVDEILELFQKYPISYFPAVPSLFNLINQHPWVKNGGYSLATVKACISGSAPLLESVRMAFEQNTGGYLVEGYGLSEAPTATHCNPILGKKRSGSIGLPLPDVDCRITSLQDDRLVVNQGEEGELWVRGPQIMLGYLNDKRETRKTLQNGWLRTGDVARMDSDGYFYLSGRIKELIKVHGMQVWPNEVEAIVSQHPSVLECAIAGVPDETQGEVVKAWVVLKPGHTLGLEDLRSFCRGKLVGYKIPSMIEHRAFLPKTAVGKTLRRVLVEQHNSK